MLRAARSLPTNRYIGWDVIVDEGGTPIILEGNARPGLDVNQVERGLLSDPKVRRFYEQCCSEAPRRPLHEVAVVPARRVHGVQRTARQDQMTRSTARWP